MPTSEELFNAIPAGDEAQAIVAGLLEADPALANVPNENGLSPLKFSLYCRRPDLAELIIAAGATIDIYEACALGDLPKLTELLDARPEALETCDADGFRLLPLACFFAQTECAKFLIERGADVNAPVNNPTRIRPIHSAAASGSTEIVTMLLEAGADADAKQQKNYTALMSAAMQNNLPMAKALLKAGANPMHESEDGRTACNLAQEAGHKEMEVLLEEVIGNSQ